MTAPFPHQALGRVIRPTLTNILIAGLIASCGGGEKGPRLSAPVPVPIGQPLVVRPTCPVPTNLVVEDLGTFGMNPSMATDINEQGQVAGYSVATTGEYRAFQYAGAGLSFLGSAPNGGRAAFAKGINASGQMAVDLDYNSTGLYTSARFTSAAAQWNFIDSGFGYVTDINNAGVVVGLWHIPVGGDWGNLPGRFTGSGGWESLGSLGGLHAGAEAISDDGTIVGWSYLSTTPLPAPYWQDGHAFVWKASTGLRDMNTMIAGGSGWELIKAFDISNDGSFIVGQGLINGTRIRAFRYHDGVIDNLGTLPGGHISYAKGVNNRGDVVGVSYPDSSNNGLTSAVVFTADLGLVDLNATLPANSGWQLAQALRINSKREIVGWGRREGGAQHPFRMQLPLPCGSNGNALLVVDNAAAMQAQDNLVAKRLQHLGFIVEAKSASASLTQDAAGKAIVYVSESVSSGQVAAKFKSVVVPVMITEPAVLDDMGMAGSNWGSQQGSDSGLTSLRIADVASPLAAGLKGNITLATAASTWIWAKPSAAANIITTQTGDTTKATTFTYDVGATMFDGTRANGRRVGWFAGNNSTPNLNNEGWRLFDAAVLWATDKATSKCTLNCSTGQQCVNAPAGPACMQVSTGAGACVRAGDGSLRCWGDGTNGALGVDADYVGDNERPDTSVNARLGASATSVTTGGHTCAIVTGGAVKCFGPNTYGQLGYGNTTAIGRTVSPASVAAVNLGEPALRVVAGNEHTCSLLQSGRIACWGRNDQGQLGLGQNTGAFAAIGDEAAEANLTTTTVDLGTSRGVIDLAAGGNATCAVFADGKVRCWGAMQVAGLDGFAGHLGDVEKPGVAAPVTLPGAAVSVGVGLYHACAVLADGGVTCWGSNNYGQLGNGNLAGIGYGSDSAAMPPPVLRFESPVKQMSLGLFHSCALLQSGAVRCWGHNQFGQLGLGHTNQVGDDETATSVPALTFSSKVVQLAGGIYQTCALLENGSVRCWGNGAGGVLGTGNQSNLGDNELATSVAPVAVGGSVAAQDNWINNGSFEQSIDGWYPMFEGAVATNGAVQISRETVDTHGTSGALRVKVGPFPKVPAFASNNGAQVGTNRTIPEGSSFTLAFWAKRVSGDPAGRLAAYFGGTTQHSDPLITLTNEWQRYEITLFNNWYPYGELAFGLLKNENISAQGEFLIDDIVMRTTPRCEDVMDGEISGQAYCRIDKASYPTEEVQVSFEARAVSEGVNLAVTGWMGRYAGEGFTALGGQWKPVSLKAHLRYPQETISLRTSPSFMARDFIASVPGVFAVRNFRIEPTEPCEAVDPANLVWRSTMKCDRFGYQAWVHDQAEPAERSELLPVNLSPETATSGDGTNSIRVTIPTFPPPIATYTHNYGLMVHMRQPIAQGEWLRVAFDAKRTDAAGSRFLRLNRPYGGDTGFNTVTLNDDWQHYELTTKEDYGTRSYIMTMLPSNSADQISPPVTGSFALDNMRVERLPACDAALDVTRESLVSCTLPAGVSPGTRLKVRFAAQSQGGASALRVTRPWGLDAGAEPVTLSGALTEHESSIVIDAPNEPLTFRLIDSTHGQLKQEPAPGKFRLANVRFETLPACDGSQGLAASLAKNGTFECDLYGWSLGRWDSVTGTYVTGGLSQQLVPGANGSAKALRVTVGPAQPGVVTPDGYPAGARVQVGAFTPAHWVSVEFDARRSDPSGASALHFYPASNGERWVSLTDDWQHYRVAFRYLAPLPEIFFYLSSAATSWPRAAAVGAFDLDNVVVRELEDCTAAAIGPHKDQYECNIPSPQVGQMDYQVTYEVRSLDGEHDFSVTRPEGYSLGSVLQRIGPEWKTFKTNVRFRNIWEPQEGALSFRVVDRSQISYPFPRGQGRFELRNVAFGPSVCPAQTSTIVMNDSFGCDIGWWHPFVHGHGTANPNGAQAAQSQLVELAKSSESAPGASDGSLLVTQLPGIDDGVHYYTHTTGAIFILREDINLGSKIRVSFDAKVPAGSTTSRFMRFNRTWGGLAEPTTIKLTESWQHFEQVITEQYGSTFYQFVLQTNESQSAVAIPAVGSFLLDNVKLERVVDCASANSNSQACDDGNACTDGDRCNVGACVGTAKVCDDSNACTADQCTAGACTFTPTPSAPGCCSGVVAGQRLASSPDVPHVYEETWETCGNAMETAGAADATYAQDQAWNSCVPLAGARVTTLGASPVRTSWFKPITVVPGGTYCLSAAIKWTGGARPYVAVVRSGADGVELPSNRLIGSTAPTGLGGTQTPIQASPPPWRYYRAQFVVPADTTELRIESGLETQMSPGESMSTSSAMDDVQLKTGPCE